jgi:GNAT superfamily N-acetyltransferase
MNVRKASPADAEGIATVHIKTWQTAYVEFFPPEYLQGMSRFLTPEGIARRREGLASTEHTTFIAEERGDILGFATVLKNGDGLGDEVGELGAIYVDPDAWDRGVGTALINAVHESLAASGFQRAILWTLAANERTRRFYERRGWHFDGTTKPHQTGAELVRYARELDAAARQRGD